MIIAVASGKGGTGKTFLATNLALSLTKSQLLDCDVEEPNSHFFLRPHIDGEDTVSLPVPRIDESRCTHCGHCAEICRYHALAVLPDRVMVFPQLCHGCGGCSLLCPEGAISEEPRPVGIVRYGSAAGIGDDGHEVVYAGGIMNVGEALAVPVVKAVRAKAVSGRQVVIDAPPGTSCPVVAALRGADFAVLVTEPTPFGLHDLELAVGVVEKLGIPCGIVINRADIGDSSVARYCGERRLPVLLEIPFDREIAAQYAAGVAIAAVRPDFREALRNVYEKIEQIIAGG